MTAGVQETSNPLREAQVGDRRAAAKADPCVHRPRHLDRHKEPFLRLMISLDATEAQGVGCLRPDGRSGRSALARRGGDGPPRVLRPGP